MNNNTKNYNVIYHSIFDLEIVDPISPKSQKNKIVLPTIRTEQIIGRKELIPIAKTPKVLIHKQENAEYQQEDAKYQQAMEDIYSDACKTELKKLIPDLGLSYKECASQLDISYQTLYKYTSGKSAVQLYTIAGLIAIYNRDITYVLGNTKDTSSYKQSHFSKNAIVRDNGVYKINKKVLNKELQDCLRTWFNYRTRDKKPSYLKDMLHVSSPHISKMKSGVDNISSYDVCALYINCDIDLFPAFWGIKPQNHQ